MAVFVISFATLDAKDKKGNLSTVVYCTSIDCENCAKKIRENVSFEKGVKDLKVDLSSRTVKIEFDPSRTDTLRLEKAINKLGYEARVVRFEGGK